MIRSAGRLGGVLARHAAALVVTVAAACVVWTGIYVVLLSWAVVSDGGPGGPLAYPAGLLFTFVAATVVGLGLLLPSTLGGELIARRRGWPLIVQIPLSVAGLAVLCLVALGLASSFGSQLTLGDVNVAFAVFLALLVPLGFLWWTAQSGPLLISIIRRRAHRGEV